MLFSWLVISPGISEIISELQAATLTLMRKRYNEYSIAIKEKLH